MFACITMESALSIGFKGVVVLVVFCAVCLVAVAVFFVVIYAKARARTLPLNRAIGFRTEAIMRDEPTWERTHQRFAPVFLADGLLFAFAGVWLAVSIFVPALKGSANYVVLAAMCILLLITVVGGVMANRFASREPRPGSGREKRDGEDG